MEQSKIHPQENYLDPLNRPTPDHLSMVTLWNSLEPSLQIQLTQCLVELIHRIRTAVAAIEKEGIDEP